METALPFLFLCRSEDLRMILGGGENSKKFAALPFYRMYFPIFALPNFL